jgi:hypothetical protein
LAAWIVMVFFALLFVGLETFLGGAQHVVWRHPMFARDFSCGDPSDGIDWSDDDDDGNAVTIIDREETLRGCRGLYDTP